ncbi:MAG: carboxypeptidase regulatory-like domain-containing protein [Deltaproteobacteria bacterium]|nr:carboxypeptidase regulatory-like domain-containing protein [Deltaproteobacteria bacterium]
MRNHSALVICVALLLCASGAFAQGVTSGALAGQVVDTDQTAMPGAQITAVHEPTGTRYSAVTDNDGRYRLPSVRVGGPYTVSVEMQPFKNQSQGGVYVKLGETANAPFELSLEAIEETVNVVADAGLINPNRTGSTSSVSTESLEELPTIGRGLEDFTRLNPFFTVTPDGDGSGTITVAGRNSRYNNLQIDGAVNNDLFGLADTGTPGGQTESTPISLDAIAELQLVLAPFDVRQGGFSGGGINAVTRSGSNKLAGSVFYFTRDDSYVGDGPSDFSELGTFEDDQYGFRIGGPIKQDKLFFFVNGEIGERTTPTGFALTGSAGELIRNGDLAAEGERFRNLLQTQYGFDPGVLTQQNRNTDSDKFFGRLDFNVGTGHQLTLRHNFVDAENLILRPASFAYEFPSHAYLFANETNSTVAQLNSVFGSNSFNELRLTNQTIKDRRAGVGQPFPYIRIENVDGAGGRVSTDLEAGTERFSTMNSLDQDIFEITNDFTFLKGNHSITIGTHNEFFTFDNLFVREAFGAYRFDDVDAFEAGIANRYDHTFSNDSDPFASFGVDQLGFYAGDQWRVRDNLTLNYGVRLDIPLFPDTPNRNPLTEEVFGFRTDEIPDGNELWSPRIGFNWDIKNDGRQQLRGGVGLFSGRSPFVWVSNAYGGTGVEFTRISARGAIPFNPDPFNQPQTIGGASSQEVNLIDPNFEFPSLLRVNLAYDTQLPWWGLLGTLELIHADSQNEIAYQNLNIERTGEAQPFDGRPLFQRRNSDFSGAYFLTNTSEGESTNVSVKIEKPNRGGISGFVSYVWGNSEVVNDGTSSQAVSNWQFNEAIDPNNPRATRSDFEVEHRFSASLNYQFEWGQSGWGTTVSAFYNHQSGRPYSAIYGRQQFPSINGDRFFSNDLVYVPSGPDDVVLTNGTWDQLAAFVNSVDGLNFGEIAERNASVGPWTSSVDLRLAQDIPIGGSKVQVTLDVLNFLNLLDSGSGHVRFASFNSVTPFNFEGVTDDGRPIYGLDGIVTDPDNEDKFTLDNLRSRWQAKLGVRWTF